MIRERKKKIYIERNREREREREREIEREIERHFKWCVGKYVVIDRSQVHGEKLTIGALLNK